MDRFKKLLKEIDIPVVVQQHSEDAFSQIRKEDYLLKSNRKTRFFRTPAAAVACICLLAIGSLSVYAALHHVWSRGMQGTLQATDEQQQDLAEKGIADVIGESPDYKNLAVTDNGITVTPETVIADENFVHLSFSVKGFELYDAEEPSFEDTLVSLKNGPDNALSMYASFYNGIVEGEDGELVYEDGSPIEHRDDEYHSTISHYADENGTLEYVITCRKKSGTDTLLGKTVQVDLKNMGTISNAARTNRTEGKWSFLITLPSASAATEKTIEKQVEDTVFKLETASISPISIKLEFSIDGEIVSVDGENVFPLFYGVVLKDGTRLPYLWDGAASDYTDESHTSAYVLSSFTRVIDPDQVSAIILGLNPNYDMVEIPIK